MAKKPVKTRPIAAKPAAAPPAPKPRLWLWPALIAVCVLVFYWTPLTSPSASIQWDAADMHYPLQKTFSDRMRPGELPFWSPYIFSGYPLLANPEMAAWYLPHWPVFLAGVTPRGIQFELVLHAFFACLGAWLLLSRILENRAAALAGAFAYAFSGFFAGHSSHVGIFSTAAGFPWLLLAFRRAMDAASPLRWAAAGGLVGGMMILAGYFQAAMYAYLALGLYAVAEIWSTRKLWIRAVAVTAGMLALGIAIASIEVLPGLEATGQSIRAANDFSHSREGVLHANALATLVAPNALGALSGPYTGPSDITQHYFYAGILLLPLAAAGLMNRKMRIPAAALIVLPAWYMLGPAGGLYLLSAYVPGLYKVRAPIQGWFIVAFGLAMLAAAGFDWLSKRWRIPYFVPVVLAVLFADVWYWNSSANPLAYARASFETLYGANEDIVRNRIQPDLPELSRLDAPRSITAMGPLDHPLNLRMESTYGYFSLELAAYDQYTDAMTRNPKLRDGLNVSRVLSIERQQVEPNPTVLPRAYFPKRVTDVRSEEESRHALETLDPAAGSVVLAPHPEIRQDAAAEASIVSHDERTYRIRYRAASPSLLRLSVTWFPGWRATADGRDCPVVRVDHALVGVIVPAGAHEAEVRFHSNYFGVGAALSAFGLLIAAVGMAWRRKGETPVLP